MESWFARISGSLSTRHPASRPQISDDPAPGWMAQVRPRAPLASPPATAPGQNARSRGGVSVYRAAPRPFLPTRFFQKPQLQFCGIAEFPALKNNSSAI